MEKTLIINREQCRQILTVQRCIPAMENALKSVSRQQVKMLQRVMIGHDNGNSLAAMPASELSRDVTGAKIIIFPGPETAKAKTNQGIIPLFEVSTGRLKAIVDAELITVIRTAATSARATKVLAKADSSTVAILGSGKQGIAHAKAMIEVRPVKTVYFWDLHLRRAEKACRQMSELYPDVNFVCCETAKKAVENADIICTTTPGKTQDPVLKGRWVKKGAHVNAVGACSANGRELDGELISKSKVFTDWNEAVMRDGGDILLSLKLGEIDAVPQLVQIGDVLNGTSGGRQNEDQITIFESVGISVEDIAAADMIYNRAKEKGIGTYLEI